MSKPLAIDRALDKAYDAGRKAALSRPSPATTGEDCAACGTSREQHIKTHRGEMCPVPNLRFKPPRQPPATTGEDAEKQALREALRPFAKAWEEAQPWKDFDGQDCRETFLANAICLDEFEAAHRALLTKQEN